MLKKIYKVNESISLVKTISLMNQLEKISLSDSNFINWINDTFGVENYNASHFFKYLHRYIYSHFIYKNDEYDETLIAPRINYKMQTGDCDDFSLFAKTILDYFGYKTCYVIAGENNTYSHIFVVVFNHGNKYIIDGTNPYYNEIEKRYNYFKEI